MVGRPQGRARRGRYVETLPFLRGVARMMAAAGKRVGEGDLEEFQQLLALREQLDWALTESVAGLRAAGMTWDEIGAATGTTRQAALMRWNPRLERRERRTTRTDPETVVEPST